MPWPSAPSVTAASPVRTPARRLEPGPRAPRDRVDQLERRADRALRVVLVRDRRAPDRHHRVADELLDGASVAGDDLARGREVPVEEVADVLRVQSSDSGVNPTRSTNMTEMRRISFAAVSGEVPGRSAGAPPSAIGPDTAGPRLVPHSPQNFAPTGFAAPQAEQSLASRCPHSRQNLPVGSFCVPQLPQVSTMAG